MDFMDFKELPSPPPIPAQVETGIPRAAVCLLSGCFYFFLFLLQHQKTGLGGWCAERGLSTKPFGEVRPVRGTRGPVMVRDSDPTPEGRHVGGLAAEVPSGFLILALLVLGFLPSTP